MSRRFPIMGGPSLPWEMIEPHERQALENHDHSLERLAERGGLDPTEALAVLDDARYRDSKWSIPLYTRSVDRDAAARAELARRLNEWETARAAKEVLTLRARVTELEGQLAVARNEARAAIEPLRRLWWWAKQHPTGPVEADGVASWVRSHLAKALYTLKADFVEEVPAEPSWSPEGDARREGTR